MTTPREIKQKGHITKDGGVTFFNLDDIKTNLIRAGFFNEFFPLEITGTCDGQTHTISAGGISDERTGSYHFTSNNKWHSQNEPYSIYACEFDPGSTFTLTACANEPSFDILHDLKCAMWVEKFSPHIYETTSQMNFTQALKAKNVPVMMATLKYLSDFENGSDLYIDINGTRHDFPLAIRIKMKEWIDSHGTKPCPFTDIENMDTFIFEEPIRKA